MDRRRRPRRPRGAAPSRGHGVGTGGERAVAAELGEERPLGVDAPAGGLVLDGGEARRAASASSSRHSTASARLADLRQHRVDVEPLGDVVGQAEAVERGGRHHDGVVRQPPWPAASACSRAGSRSAGRGGGAGARPGGAAIRWPPPRPRAGRRAWSPTSASRGSPRSGHGGEDEAGHRDRRQVLGAVHREVGAAVEHGGLHLLGEHALAAELPDRHVEAAVALGVDHDEPRPRGRDRAARSSDATCSACQRARGLPRVAARSVGTGLARRAVSSSSRAKSSRSAATSRSPRGEPAASLSATDGSWSSLPMMPVGERLDGVELAGVELAEPGAVALDLGLAHLLGPVAQRHDHRRHLASRRWRRGSARARRR